MKSRLNAYIGYIVPRIMSGCQVWYPSKTDLRIIEKLPKNAKKWICGSEPDYKKRLTETELLKLSLYAELQSLLLYCSIIDGRYGKKISNFINIKANERTGQSTNTEIVRQMNRLHKTNKNFGHRLAILFNIVSKSVNLQ